MKLVTKDYGCGISSSILDYEIEDVIVVSENRYEHVFDENDVRHPECWKDIKESGQS